MVSSANSRADAQWGVESMLMGGPIQPHQLGRNGNFFFFFFPERS